MGVITADMLVRLLDEHSSALVLYARQWCDAPEDVVQEAVLQLMRQPVAPENLAGWMYHVVRNLALNAARESQRRARREAEAAYRREPWFTPSEDDRLDAAVATEALAGLPLEQRETIVARIWGGLSFEEITQLTGSSTSSVHRWYHQGLAALRERLGATWQRDRTGTMT
jgi:RNA polymerase sigma-70 factor (ECF subfamily)